MTSIYSEDDIQKFFDEALRLIKNAGTVVVDAIAKAKEVSTKESDTDVVTATDKAVEQMLFEGLRTAFPCHKFIGEETTAASGKIEEFGDEPTWIIDPIDGTMNFVHSNPMVSISVGLVIQKRIVIGIVFAPVIGKLYTAIKGKGAFLNGERISVSGCEDMKNAMFLMEVHARDPPESEAVQIENFTKTIPKFHAVRSIGSAAIDLALVAAGSADAFFHFGGIHCWDVVAGAILVSEAGGYLVNGKDGSEFDYMDRYILATNSKSLSDQIVGLKLKTVAKEKDYPELCPL